jgi:hypothetical protein
MRAPGGGEDIELQTTEWLERGGLEVLRIITPGTVMQAPRQQSVWSTGILVGYVLLLLP